jgi:hypothetical protein
MLHGPPGSGKSTAARFLRLLIDPRSGPLSPLPKTGLDAMIAAASTWLLVYDDAGAMPGWLFDHHHRPVFSAGFGPRIRGARARHGFIRARRPVILSGVEHPILYRDLAGSTVLLHLPPLALARRRAEDELWTSFQANYPTILSALLDAVADGWERAPLRTPPHRRTESNGGSRNPATLPFTARDRTRWPESAEMAPNESTSGNALLQIGPLWRDGRPPMPSSTNRPRKTWSTKPPPWPTPRAPVHRNGFSSPLGPALFKKPRSGKPR